jgi:hypothetical protein
MPAWRQRADGGVWLRTQGRARRRGGSVRLGRGGCLSGRRGVGVREGSIEVRSDPPACEAAMPFQARGLIGTRRRAALQPAEIVRSKPVPSRAETWAHGAWMLVRVAAGDAGHAPAAAPGARTGAQEGCEVDTGRKRTAGQGPVGCALIPVRAGVAAVVILAVLEPAIGGMLSCIQRPPPAVLRAGLNGAVPAAGDRILATSASCGRLPSPTRITSQTGRRRCRHVPAGPRRQASPR